MKIFTQVKFYIFIIFIVLFGVMLMSCKDEPTDDINITSHNLSVFYDDLIAYEERLSELAVNTNSEISDDHNITALDVYQYDTYTKEELLATYLGSSFDMVAEGYKEQLMTTRILLHQLEL